MINVPGPIARSEFRKEIDEMLSEGETYVAISNWLRNNGEVISRELLSKYHRFCFNINAKAVEIYTQADSEAKLQEEGTKVAISMKLVDKAIESAMNVDTRNIDDKSLFEIGLKGVKLKEELLAAHGDMEAEQQTQLLKEIRDELLKKDLKQLLRGLSDERTRKRIANATRST